MCWDDHGDDCFTASHSLTHASQELVRGVHALLDELGPAPVVKETEALNLTSVPPRSKRSSNIKDFKVEVREGETTCLPAWWSIHTSWVLTNSQLV
jgi:hypothetical protein